MVISVPTAVNYGIIWFIPLTIVSTDACWRHCQGSLLVNIFVVILGTGGHNWKHVNFTWMNARHCITKKKNLMIHPAGYGLIWPTPPPFWSKPIQFQKGTYSHFEPFTFFSNPFTPPHTSPPNTPTKTPLQCLQCVLFNFIWINLTYTLLYSLSQNEFQERSALA